MPDASVLAQVFIVCLRSALCCESLHLLMQSNRASLVAQWVENLPALQETQAQPRGREGPLEEGVAAHSRIPTWRTPWTEEPGGLQSTGSPRRRHDLATGMCPYIIAHENI